MLECLILGDSIAVGTHQFRTGCALQAKVGITSQAWNSAYLERMPRTKSVIISLGSNDHAGTRTKAQLQRIREKAGTDAQVFWIMPAVNHEAQAAIRAIAREYKDTVLPIARLARDRVHPTMAGYQQLAEKTK
jgi:lysophospholipase L1-like esterase